MTKLLALATALIFAATTYTSTAQAGMRVGLGSASAASPWAPSAPCPTRAAAAKPASTGRARKSALSAASARRRPRFAPPRSRSPKPGEAEKETSRNRFHTKRAASSLGKDSAPAPVTTGSTDIAAQTENSSISLASANDAGSVKKIDTASQETKSLDCKKFFPSVGMTLSVPCE